MREIGSGMYDPAPAAVMAITGRNRNASGSDPAFLLGWGLVADHTVIENRHLLATKRLLNTNARTPSDIVYGTAGRCR